MWTYPILSHWTTDILSYLTLSYHILPSYPAQSELSLIYNLSHHLFYIMLSILSAILFYHINILFYTIVSCISYPTLSYSSLSYHIPFHPILNTNPSYNCLLADSHNILSHFSANPTNTATPANLNSEHQNRRVKPASPILRVSDKGWSTGSPTRSSMA